MSKCCCLNNWFVSNKANSQNTNSIKKIVQPTSIIKKSTSFTAEATEPKVSMVIPKGPLSEMNEESGVRSDMELENIESAAEDPDYEEAEIEDDSHLERLPEVPMNYNFATEEFISQQGQDAVNPAARTKRVSFSDEQ